MEIIDPLVIFLLKVLPSVRFGGSNEIFYSFIIFTTLQ